MASSGPKSPKPPRHESVIKLLEKFPGQRYPKRIIKQLAHERLADARKKGWSGPIFCPKVLASIYGIKCHQVDHDIGGEGRIIPDPKRPERPMIEYRSGRMEERQRFTMFHEFAHTLFPDYCVLTTYHQEAPTEKDPEKEFENLCDAAAAEFMMPEDTFTADLAGQRVSGSLILSLKKRYHASLDATIRRVVDLTSAVPCSVLFLKAQGKGNAREVSYSLKNSLFSSYIPSGAKVRWTGPNDTPTKMLLPVDTYPRRHLVEALELPTIADNPNYPTTALLLLPPDY
jgi:hypothetical protein